MRALALATVAGIALFTNCFSDAYAESPTPAAVAESPWSYADLADLATVAPMVIEARVYSTALLKPERAPGLAAGFARFYVEADVVSLIRGSGPLAARISYLVDLPLDAKGKPPKLKKKQPVLLFARKQGPALPQARQFGWIRGPAAACGYACIGRARRGRRHSRRPPSCGLRGRCRRAC